jgi:hypothetical protein
VWKKRETVLGLMYNVCLVWCWAKPM